MFAIESMSPLVMLPLQSWSWPSPQRGRTVKHCVVSNRPLLPQVRVPPSKPRSAQVTPPRSAPSHSSAAVLMAPSPQFVFSM